MDKPRDSWLQEQIERYRVGNATSAAFYQQAVSLLSAQQLLAAGAASRHRRLHSLGRLLRAAFGRSLRRGQRASRQPPTVLEGIVTPMPSETGQAVQTVIVIGVQQQTKGE